jgi:hypothetical protein
MTHSFSEISQDSDTGINEDSVPDAEINWPDLSGSGGNSDDSQADENAGSGDGACCGYDDAADDDDNDDVDNNEHRALWDKNDHDFCKIPFCALSGYKLPQNGQVPASTNQFFCYF